MGKKKPFIKKNEGVTFSLVHRSQRDPMIANPDAGDHILEPLDKKTEQLKYGVYYDDDYNYLQHLRDTNEVLSADIEEREVIRVPTSAMQLPSTVFETKGVELKVGLLNQSAPKGTIDFDIDPEIAAALEGDGDFDELDDDFIVMANDGIVDGDAEMDDDDVKNVMLDEAAGRADIMARFGLVRDQKNSESEDYSDEEDDFFDADEHLQPNPNRRQNKINELMSSASISSSCKPRSEAMRNLDEEFEQLCDEYEDDKIGYGVVEEDGDEEAVELDSEAIKEQLQIMRKGGKITVEELEPVADEVKRKTLKLIERSAKQGEELEEVQLESSGRKRNHWDCESILSTYSNAYNHPTVIREPSRKKFGLTKKDIDAFNGMMETETVSVISGTSISTIRNKNETPEERKLRKEAVKAHRRERRVEKKANKLAFKEQEQLMTKQTVKQPVTGRSIK